MQVCMLACVCTRMCMWTLSYTSSDIFPKKIAITIEADRGIFHDYRSCRQVIEHSPNYK